MFGNTTSEVILSWYDYTSFIATLTFSTLIGIYFGFFGSKQSTTHEYLMGDKTMKPLPIALSLMSGQISAISLIVIPHDTYQYGAYFFLFPISIILQSLINIFIYLPVYFNIEITSIYEYLEKRFDRNARLLVSFLYILSELMYLPIVIYTAALTCSIVFGVNLHLLNSVLCCVCIFYTSVSGLKGVIWTDALQFIILIGTVTFIFVLSLKSSGGFSSVWNKAVKGQRLDIFDLNLDPTKRMSLWTFVFGQTATYLALNSVTQSSIQKYMTLPTFRDVILSAVFYAIGICIYFAIIVFIGLEMYAKYTDCDPLEAKKISKSEQMFPFFVLDVAGHVPGVPGIFTAGIVSASLSTMSVTLNAMAGSIYFDFLENRISHNVAEKTRSLILKLIVVLEGVACYSMVYMIEYLGDLMSVFISFTALTFGPLLGIFSLGLLFTKANSKGAFYGTLIGLIFGASIIFPNIYFQFRGWITYSSKSVSTDGCHILNDTVTVSAAYVSNTTIKSPPIPFLFKISFMYQTLMSAFVTVVVGLMISYVNNKNQGPIDRSLISPVGRLFMTKKRNIVSEQDENALNLLIRNSDKVAEEVR